VGNRSGKFIRECIRTEKGKGGKITGWVELNKNWKEWA
jgi:hypothetical protein